MIKSENFLVVQGFMITDLKLSGNELLCYALIYGFSQDGISSFSGSSKYISEWLNVSQRTVFSLLQSLVEKGYIEKTDKEVNGVKLCDYKVIDPMKKVHTPHEKISVPPYEEISHHNIDIENIEEKKENIKRKTDESKTLEQPFAEFWSLYPSQRKGSKQNAFKAYCRVIKQNRATADQLLEAVKRYSESKTVADGYAKGCEAWLNDDRFNWKYEPKEKEQVKSFVARF